MEDVKRDIKLLAFLTGWKRICKNYLIQITKLSDFLLDEENLDLADIDTKIQLYDKMAELQLLIDETTAILDCSAEVEACKRNKIRKQLRTCKEA